MTLNSSRFKAIALFGGLVSTGLAAQFFLFPRLAQNAHLLAGSMGSPGSEAHLTAATGSQDGGAGPGRAGMADAKVQQKSAFLTCAALRERTRDFLKMHYSIRDFDAGISKRSFQKYFQFLDPGRNFFLQSDIDSFAHLESKLGENVGRLDCRFISDIYAVYLKRLDESGALIDSVLKTPFDFKQEESLETDRKKVVWAKDASELKERWRKLLKFGAMGLRETEPDGKKMSARLSKRYALMRKTMQEMKPDDVYGFFLNAFAVSLDPHSQYLMPEDQDEFKVAFSLQLVGIGASLTQQDGFTMVDSVIPGGAAARDGRLKKGDKIVAVDSGDGSGFTDVIDMDLNKVVQLIRGKKDTLVKLVLLRKNEQSNEMKRQTLELVRDVVRLADGEAHSGIIELNNKKIGVINLPSFYIDYQGSRQGNEDFRSSANDMAREMKKLNAQGVDGIIVDLRRDGGGDLGECIKITGHFIDRGPVVQVQSRDGDVESLDDKDGGTLYNGPLAVLISKQSASASEIFAGAMQDYGRGLILGNSRTYGKATVQNVIEIPGSRGRESDGAMKVTISKFFRPSGSSNQERGVESDIVIPDIVDVSDIGEAENDYVLPYTTIPAARRFKPLQDLGRLVPELRKRSEARVKDAKDFKDIFTTIEKAKKEKENTLLSLKIDDKKGGKDGKGKDGSDGKLGTVTPAPGDKAESGVVAVRADDHELKEAARVLLDSVELLGGKTEWTR